LVFNQSKPWVLVTGAAGFIGSNLSRELLNNYNVIGIDNFHDYYDPNIKRRNLARISGNNSFIFLEKDISDFKEFVELPKLEGIFHLAAQPGVRDSWRDGFKSYAINNVLGTQQMLDLAVRTGTTKFIYSSSSSVYGDSSISPTSESAPTSPISPYGVSKLTGELLASSYAKANGINVRSLRYFTVYGPGQRPDMAIHRLIKYAITGETFTQFGDGSQIRDFTFINDVVNANIKAFEEAQETLCETFNVGGGEGISLENLIQSIQEIVGKKLEIKHEPKSQGDVKITKADISAINKKLGWSPKVRLAQGLEEQVQWHKQLLG
jgi:UDP-glucose 4-epimerase